MTIRSVSAIALDLPYEIWGPKPVLAGKPRNMDMLFIRVETDSGLVGWGEAFGFAVWPSTKAAIETLIAPLAIGRDERDIGTLMTDLQRKFHLLGRTGPVMYALSGLDIALWDLAGKVAGKPVVELLGGKRRTELPAYASLMRYTNPDVVARNAAAAVAQGFTAIKLHEITIEPIRAAREAVGPDVKIMLDTNCPWSVAESLAMCDKLREFDLFWLEEPIWPPEDHVSLAEVRLKGGIATGAGENAVSYLDFANMFAANAVDYAQPSATKIGGITELLRVARLAEARGVVVAPHSPYLGSGLLATLHVVAALEHDALIEYCWCELGANPLGDAISASNGKIAVPTGPGLGRDPDPAILEHYRAG